MKTVAFLPAHPSQVWVLSQVANALSSHAKVLWYLRDKDCSAEIADALGIRYQLLSSARTGYFGNALEMFGVAVKAVRCTKRDEVDLWVTKYGAGNFAASLLGKSSISFNDDDADLVPLIAFTSYTFAKHVLVTSVTRMGKYESKAIRYPSFHELFYLHPNRFTPDPEIKQELGLADNDSYGIVRLSSLSAHHDYGVRGIAVGLVEDVLELTGDKMRLFISSERPLEGGLEGYRVPIRPERMHHALACADFFLGDSQTMTAEAAVLGTPALRVSDFVGRISYIAELERYGLAFGFLPGDEQNMLKKLAAILEDQESPGKFAERRRLMLADNIDPVPWFVDQLVRALDQ